MTILSDTEQHSFSDMKQISKMSKSWGVGIAQVFGLLTQMSRVRILELPKFSDRSDLREEKVLLRQWTANRKKSKHEPGTFDETDELSHLGRESNPASRFGRGSAAELSDL